VITAVVTGDQELIAKLEAFIQMNDLTRAYEDSGDTVARTAKALAPYKTGRLKGSITSQLRESGKVVVQAGRGIGPYAPIVHYGQYKNYESQPFLTNALAIANNGYIEFRFDSEMDKTMKIVGL